MNVRINNASILTMSEKIQINQSICANMTSNNPTDVIWNTSDPLTNFPNDNCLPVIGSCQVSSILSTLENMPTKTTEMLKTCLEPQIVRSIDTFKSIPINVINSDAVNTEEIKNRKKKKKEGVVVLEKKQLYQEMVYFGCNFCPFICTKDSKISDHINSVHKNQENNVRPQLKCPGCPNIFYHKLSLRSHLLHDHEVARSDITKIVNGVVYISILNSSGDKKITPLDFLNVEMNTSSEEDSNDASNIETPTEEKVSHSDGESELNFTSKVENLTEILPDVNEQLNNNDTAPPKVEETKKTQKCCVSTCAVRMKDIVNMAYHIKCHFGKVFRCLECNANFVIWKTLQTHLWRAHHIDMELYSCDKCDYKTYSLAKLNNVHKLIHGDEKPFLCDLCGKGFKNPKQLRNHKMIHKVKPPDHAQQCQICDRTFTDKRQLKVHMSGVHQKIKPFSCSFCGYKGASNGALKLHIRQHTGEKPFSCDSCDYITSDHNSLRRHKSRHSGIKKYKCLHCDYACIQSSTFKTHLKTKHPGLENELMFSCVFCQFRSISKDKYMIHIASHKEKKKQNGRKLDDLSDFKHENISLIENCTDTVELTGGIIEKDAISFSLHDELKSIKKSEFIHDSEVSLEDMPVALISKVDIDHVTTENCIILPVQNGEILNLAHPLTDPDNISTGTAISNGLQYLYNTSSVILEVTDDKKV